MRRSAALLAAFPLLVALGGAAEAQHAVILVRHAERETDPAILDGLADAEHPLSEAGEARAGALARVLADSGVTAVYTSGALRTRATAAPLAEAAGLAPEVLDMTPQVLAGLPGRLRERHAGGVVLIVGHSNTLPAIADALMGRPSGVRIGPDDYDGLFVLVPDPGGKWGLIRSRY